LKGESRNQRSELREALDGVYDDGNRILRLVWADRQAEDLIGELFSYWQGARGQETRVRIRSAQVRGDWVMDDCLDALIGEVLLQKVALRMANHE
jgi:hypothetical protein